MSPLKSLSINTSDYYDEGDYRRNLFRYRSRLRYEHDTQITVSNNDINVTSSKCLPIETKCISGMNCQLPELHEQIHSIGMHASMFYNKIYNDTKSVIERQISLRGCARSGKKFINKSTD